MPTPATNFFDTNMSCRMCGQEGAHYVSVQTIGNEENADSVIFGHFRYQLLCRPCHDRLAESSHLSCAYCSSLFIREGSSHPSLCRNCIPHFRCNDCGVESSPPNPLFPVSRNNRTFRVCESCRAARYSACPQCSEYYQDNEFRYNNICHYCIEDNQEREEYEDEENEEEGPTSTEKRPSFTFSKNPYKRFVGFELEFLHKDMLSGIYQYGGVHDDGSIRMENGYCPIEFSSSPTNGDLLLATINAVTKIINNAGSKVNTSCGFHVHLDMGNSSYTEQTNIKNWWKIFERTIFAFVSESRRANQYAKAVNSLRETNWTRDRYCSLNISSISKWGTFEVRLHHGTVNAEKITDWIMFLLGFFEVFSKIPLSDTRKRKVKKMSDREILIFLFQQIKFPLRLRKKFVKRVKEYGQYISFSKEKKNNEPEILTNREVITDAFATTMEISPTDFYTHIPETSFWSGATNWEIIPGEDA